MRDETAGACEERQPLHCLERPAGVEHDGGDGTGDVDRQRPPHDLRRMCRDGLERRDMIALDTEFGGKTEEDVGARVAGAMLRVADARNFLFLRLELTQARLRRRVEAISARPAASTSAM